MRVTLTLKLIVVTLLTSLIGIILVAIFSTRATAIAFDRLRIDQAQANFISQATEHYEQNSSWRGFRPPRQERRGPPPVGERPPAPPPFVLVDEDGKAVNGAGPIRPRERIPAQRLADGEPVIVAGETVGTVIFVGGTPELDARDRLYLQRTNQALLFGSVGAVIIAVIVGVALAQYLTRPLRELTRAIQATTPGKLDQQVTVRTRDELGDLTLAFNEMSAELAHSNQLRRQMTAEIAHELRTPLTVINGYLEGLRDGTLQPTPARFDTLYAEASQLQRLIEDLRTLSLADAGELKLKYQAVAPRELLDGLAAAFQPLAAERKINLNVYAEPALPITQLDRERITQVLANLVSNALRYTPAGGAITLSARNGADTLNIAVSDTGAGIPVDKLPYIFERFYRADDSRQQTSSETGLGLAIARSIIEAHNGKISADSIVGQGTTITICLPAQPTPHDAVYR